MSCHRQQHQLARGAVSEQAQVGKGCMGWPWPCGWLDWKAGDICLKRTVCSLGVFKCSSPLEAQESIAMPAACWSTLSGNSAANTRKTFHFTWGHLSILHKDRSPLACSVVQTQASSS